MFVQKNDFTITITALKLRDFLCMVWLVVWKFKGRMPNVK